MGQSVVGSGRNRKEVIVNARFRGQRVTGVQRYAHEVTRRLRSHLRCVEPRSSTNGISGHLWEQVVLPIHVGRHALLWSPANVGPISVRRQVVTIHDVAPLDHPEWFQPHFARWYGWLIPRLARRVRRIITVSEFSKIRIVDHAQVDAEKVTVIPNGVGPEYQEIEEGARKEVLKRLGIRRPYFLVLGSLAIQKNIEGVLEAWTRVREELEDAQLLIVGQQPTTATSVQVDRLINDRVVYLGYAASEDLPALYSGSVAYVNVSFYEGFGLPILEAMACGAPCIVSDIAPFREVVGDAAVYVDPSNPGDIAEAMTNLAQNSLAANALKYRGLQRARLFRWEKTAQRTLTILLEELEREA